MEIKKEINSLENVNQNFVTIFKKIIQTRPKLYDILIQLKNPDLKTQDFINITKKLNDDFGVDEKNINLEYINKKIYLFTNETQALDIKIYPNLAHAISFSGIIEKPNNKNEKIYLSDIIKEPFIIQKNEFWNKIQNLFRFFNQ